MAVSYSNLRNLNGTIVDISTNRAYTSQQDLANALGVSTSQINWGAISAISTGSISGTTYIPASSSSSNNNTGSSSSSSSSSLPAGTTWYLSSWTSSGNTWQQQPILTINGQNYTFATPQEYISKLQQLQSAGATGPLSTFISQFQSVVPNFTTTQTSNPPPASSGTVSYANLVNKNGTIYNKNGPTANTTSDGGYATEAALMRDLGVTATSQIQYSSITQNANYTPSFGTPSNPPPITTPPPTTTPPPGTTTPPPGTTTTPTGGLQFPNLKQYRIGNTYYGYDAQNGYLVAFADPNQLKQYFPNGIDAAAPTLPSSIANLAAANNAPGTVVSIGSGQPVTPITQTVPDSVEFKKTAAYMALDADAKSFVDMAYNLLKVGGEADATNFSNAIKQAMATADPYFKAQLAIALGQIGVKIADLNNNYGAQAEVISRTQAQLLQDVSAQKDLLTAEQQQELATAARGYGTDLLKIKDQAAEKGITFGAGYNTLESNMANRTASYNDVVQSASRTYNYKIQQLTLQAQRGDTAAQAQLDALNKSKGTNIKDIGYAAEQLVGSSNLPSSLTGAGYTPVGGVSGSIAEQKRAAEIADTGAFVNLQKGFL